MPDATNNGLFEHDLADIVEFLDKQIIVTCNNA